MTEQNLKAYFENSLTVELLSIDLKNSNKKTGNDTSTVFIDRIQSGEFEITKENLIKLCNDTINGLLSPTDLNTIAFALICSDFFYWNNETNDGNIISNVINEWDNPEMGFDLTLKNIELWKEYLLTGQYKLDKAELKNKFRNNKS